MIYRRRSTPLHSARAAAGCAYCLLALAARLIVANPVAAGRVALAALLGAGRRPAWPQLRRAALVSLPLALADRADQRAGHPRRADRDPAPGRPAAARPHRRHARGHRLRRDPGAALRRPDPLRRALHDGGGPRRGAAAVSPRVVPLGPDRDPGHADGADPDPRRAPAGRRPALPPGLSAVAPGADASHHRRRARPRAGRGRGAGGARLRRRARRPGATGAATRHDLAFGASAVALVALAIGARVAGLVPFQRLSDAARADRGGRHRRPRRAAAACPASVRRPPGIDG